jgi:anti-sigma28 factor (negative regulator of flagellin synthesis)
MSNTIFGPFDERFEVRSAFEGGAAIEPPYHHDPVLLASYLRRFLESPSSRDALRRALMDDPASMGRALSDEELCELVAMRLSMGVLRLVAPGGGVLQMRHVSTGGGEAHEDEQEEEERAAAEVKLRDWKLECKHHSESKRPVFERHTSIQVVPDKGQTKDTVKVHWRDDNIALPPALTVRTPGRADVEAQKAGANGPYSLYGYDVEYLGDLDNILFPLPSFWQALNEKTTYSFAPGPQSINVEVFNPRQWELEVKFPALESFKGGYKYSCASHDVSGDSLSKLSMTKKSVVKETFEVNEGGWKPSSKRVESVETKTTVKNGASSTETEKESKLFDAIVLKRDGGNLKIDAIKIASSILKFIKEGLDLVKLIKSYAPQVGWYVDLDIQVMQGGLAAEWYWKEWEDHTVFRYIDVKAMLEVFSITFEIGVGVSAFSFKLQVFGQVSGGVGVEISATRWKPEGMPGMNLGPVKGRIAGAIGARAEAGYFFKLEAKMETALELDLVIGINQPSRAVSLDGGLVWTGIQCEATGSVGAMGIGGTKKWKGELVGKSDRLRFEWPKPVEYKPPYMSRDAIAAELRKVLTNGWNVRVFTPSGSAFTFDEAWSIERIADTLAERIERDRAFHRTPDMVEALGVAIRQDLDALGTRTGRDYIESERFLAYVNGKVDGKSLVVHLNDGASPIRKLTGG